MGLSIWPLLLILVIMALPLALIILLVKKSSFKAWLMRKSEARYFHEQNPRK